MTTLWKLMNLIWSSEHYSHTYNFYQHTLNELHVYVVASCNRGRKLPSGKFIASSWSSIPVREKLYHSLLCPSLFGWAGQKKDTCTMSPYKVSWHMHYHPFMLRKTNLQGTCLINIPKSNTDRVIHSIGFGSSPIGGSSPVENKILALSLDGEASRPPKASFCLVAWQKTGGQNTGYTGFWTQVFEDKWHLLSDVQKCQFDGLLEITKDYPYPCLPRLWQVWKGLRRRDSLQTRQGSPDYRRTVHRILP